MKKERSYTITLTEADLTLVSDICHDYKDGHRGDKSSLLPVMALEKNLTEQTERVYRADPAYDYRPSDECLGMKLDRKLTEESEHFTVYRDDKSDLPLYVLEKGEWFSESEFKELRIQYGETVA